MDIKATVQRTEMGRRIDDFTSEIIDAALLLLKTVGFQAAEQYMDENLIDFDITRRVLLGPTHLRRSSDAASLVRFEAVTERRRFSC